ncbi:MAG: wax ester/triacylglycerol synthase family O-acyltransferase [Rubrivivax sp.]|nr:wax ester/triacylglycerol synthase family O-acyltransferase [Rubrivivax sp.]
MRQLSAHDAGFLYSDTLHSNANVTLISIYDQSTAPGGKVRFKSILAHIESRLAGLPVFRSKLLRVPMELDHPYWIDDPNFDLEYHVRHIALPKPGDWRQFCIQASRIHARPFDQNRPLWEIYVVEGLDSLLELPQGSFALLIKIHHAAVDAAGGSRMAMLLHDLTPHVAAPPPPRPWFPQPQPSQAMLLLRAWWHSVLSPFELRTPLARRLADSANALQTFANDLLHHPEQVVATRFNTVVSAHRVFDTRRFAVEEFDAIRRLVRGATVGDAVLAVCGDALRRHLLALGELPEAGLNAITPFQESAGGAPAERPPELTWQRVPLHTELADPVARLAAIAAWTAKFGAGAGHAAAAQGQHAAAATLARSGKMHGLLGLSASRHMPASACMVTNVAGPDVALYLNGARMTYFSAIMPISDGMGLVFAVTSYDGRIIISPTSCRELLPDPEAFTQHLRDAFQDLLALAGAVNVPPRPAAAPRARSERPRASARDSGSRPGPSAGKAATAPRAARAGRPRSAAPAD